MNNLFKIFVDFDGTITTEDVGESLFNKFGNAEIVGPLIQKLLSNEISSRDCWIELCASVEYISIEHLNLFIDSIAVDETFKLFKAYCTAKGFNLYVLSDGFDYYIDKIFNRENLSNVKYFANKLEVTSSGKLIPTFPYYDIACSSSANCKRNHIITNSGDDEFTVYIGDGNSDKYTIDYCDFIFAKDGLLKYCERNRISYFPFNNFLDVKNKLEQLQTKKNLKKRHRAELKRKEVYKAE